MKLRYEELTPIERSELLLDLEHDDPERAARALLRAALFDGDAVFVEDLALREMRSRVPRRVFAAITSIGHLARRFRSIGGAAREVIEGLLEDVDPEIRGRASDAMDDIRIYVDRVREKA